MAVKIRLQLTGSKNRRTFRVVVVDESKKRDGKIIENVGFINPLVKPVKTSLKMDRINHWEKLGAIVNPAVKKYL